LLSRTGGIVAVTRHIVDSRRQAYVMHHEATVRAQGTPMTQATAAPTSPISRPLLLVAAAAGLLLAGTVALWAHYGTAVFYEMILAGIALCL
jgi:hypothetical protein